MHSLEPWTGFIDILVQAVWLGYLASGVQFGPALRIFEGLMGTLEVQAQVKRLVLVAPFEPLERTIGITIGVIAFVFLGSAIRAMQCRVKIFSLSLGSKG